MKLRWLRTDTLLAVHEAQLAEHGGAPTLRDAGLFEAALARPQQLAAYADAPPDVPALAAAYAVALVRNHPFIDGNKRVAFVALELFLNLHNFALHANDAECVAIILALAAGELDETTFASWVRDHSAG